MRILLTFMIIVCTCIESSSQGKILVSWYKMLTGRIDRFPVVMHLHKAGHIFAGFYYYESQQQPIYFTGEDTTTKGAITLIAFTNSEEIEKFSISLLGNGGKGTWLRTEKSKPLPVNLNEASPPVNLNYVFTTGATLLRPKMKNSPQASFEAASVWPIGNNPTDNYLKDIIRESFSSSQNSNEEIGSLMLKEKKAFLDGYLKDNHNIKEADLAESSVAYNMDETARLLIAYQSPKLITLAQFVYSYTGGAHGNYGTSYTSINLVDNKKLTLSDIITDLGKANLSKLLEKIFRKAYHLEPSASLESGGLLQSKIEPNDNFYVTGKGIGFSYMPYEIGPYAMGEINLFIPYTELDQYLKPAFKGLAGL